MPIPIASGWFKRSHSFLEDYFVRKSPGREPGAVRLKLHREQVERGLGSPIRKVTTRLPGLCTVRRTCSS